MRMQKRMTTRMKTSLQDEDEDDDDDRAALLRCEGLVRRRCLAMTVSHIVNKIKQQTKTKHGQSNIIWRPRKALGHLSGDVGKLGLGEKVRSGRLS